MGIQQMFLGAGGAGFIATGGNVDGLTPGNGYKYHTFTGSGTFTVASGDADVEFLLVGGGGCGRAGGGAAGGGGGAGGLTYSSSHPVTVGDYTINVGSGSPAKNYNSPAPTPVASRVSSIFGNSVDGGGDAGSYAPYGAGDAGGSGGGGGAYGSPIAAGGTTGNGTGNSGGTGNTGGDPAYAGGGGGGAAAAGIPGAPGSGATRSDGGNGLQYPQFEGSLIGVPALSPLNGYFAGGGGGAVRIQPSPARPQGGLGGGGNGGVRTPSTLSGEDGVANSGGGGGGASIGPTNGAGGSGIVIIRYAV